MMPLCTTAMRSVACGCALLSVGLPWVAQRVWPMPIVPLSGALAQPAFQVAQLALGAPARQRAGFERGHARRVIAAIFETLERVDELPRHRLMAENPDNPAQVDLPAATRTGFCDLYAAGTGFRKIKMHVSLCQNKARHGRNKNGMLNQCFCLLLDQRLEVREGAWPSLP